MYDFKNHLIALALRSRKLDKKRLRRGYKKDSKAAG
jgi:hypothetical protein